MLPNPDHLNAYQHGKFVLSNLAAKRAKQLREGAPALIQIESNHPLTIALAEIAAGKIKPILPTVSEVVLDDAMVTILEETVPAEKAMLLPGLDDGEVAIISSFEEEHEADAVEDDELSLGSLMDDDDATATVSTDEDTLSLDDIAEQENADDDSGDAESL